VLYDGHIWRDHGMEQLRDEYWLADQHFANCGNFLTPYKQPRFGHLTDSQYLFNAILAHYRARIEHVNRVVESHKILQIKFRGEIDVLTYAAHTIAHTSNIELSRYIRYHPYGPWSHFYN